MTDLRVVGADHHLMGASWQHKAEVWRAARETAVDVDSRTDSGSDLQHPFASGRGPTATGAARGIELSTRW